MIQKIGLLALFLTGLLGCSGNSGPESADAGSETPAPEARAEAAGEESAAVPASGVSATETRVTGTIKGTQVELVGAELDDQLAIFEENGWGFSPSLLIFMFLDEGETPEGRTFSVSSDEGPNFEVTTPHVHYRWRGAESGNIESDVVSMDYDMELTLGQIENGELPGTITFSVPDEDTSVSGTFRATVED